MKRQYSGAAGRVENCQIGVFLAYATAKGRAFLERELYLPQEGAADAQRRAAAGVPETAGFQTKPQLAQRMLERTLATGTPARWVTEDAVYGSDRRLRLWLETQGVAHALAVKGNEALWADPGFVQVRAATLAEQAPPHAWHRLSVGEGAKGPRSYAWLRVPICAPQRAGPKLLAAGPAQHWQAGGTGLLRVFWPGGDRYGGVGSRRGGALGHPGRLWSGQRAGGAGSV